MTGMPEDYVRRSTPRVSPAHLVIAGFGPVSGYKYSRCIASGIRDGVLNGYTVIDLASQRSIVAERLAKLPVQPEHSFFIPDEIIGRDIDAGPQWIWDRLAGLHAGVRKKLVIATEPQAHAAYLRDSIERGVDTLTTKPVVLPMRNGLFDAASIFPETHALAELAGRSSRHSILCLGRHHDVYEHRVRAPIAFMMRRFQTPITSINLKTASGVWNLPSEFHSRDDHPYKYGYGMLMHGAYHYIDIFTRLLQMNRLIFPQEELELHITGYSAGPQDQHLRIPRGVEGLLQGYDESFGKLKPGEAYGETDIVVTAALRPRRSARTICLATLAFEQTTPGMRSWGTFPAVPYNINGRLHCTDLDVRLGTIFSVNGHVRKSPIGARRGGDDIRGQNTGIITTRSNAGLTGTQEYIREEHLSRPYGSSFSYLAESRIFARWINDEETFSSLHSHVPANAVLAGLAQIAAGEPRAVVDFNFPVPEWPSDVTQLEHEHLDEGSMFAAHRAL